jgi:hypothetical protein
VRLQSFRPGAYREVQQAQVLSASPCGRGSGDLGCAIYGYLHLALDHLIDFILRMEVRGIGFRISQVPIERNLPYHQGLGIVRSYRPKAICQQPLHCGIEIGYLYLPDGVQHCGPC